MMPTETHETTLAAPTLAEPASLARRTARAIGDVLHDAWTAAPFALAAVVAAGSMAGYRVVSGAKGKTAPAPSPPPPICPAPDKKPPDNAAKWDTSLWGDGATWGD